MKNKLFLLIVVCSIGLVGCGSQTASADLEKLESQVSELKSEITELKSENDEFKTQNEELLKLSSVINEVDTTAVDDTSVDTDKFSDVKVIILKKTSYPKDIQNGQYSPFVELVYEMQNNTDKEIQGIQGILYINDLFGETIMKMQFDLTTKNVPVGETVTVEGYGLEINEFLDEHLKLYDTSYENLKFAYEFSKVVFTDGTILE